MTVICQHMFAWATIYTFHYHPMESTFGHAFGFVHTWLLLLQGSLMFTPIHRNPYWRVLLEVWVTFHGTVVVIQIAPVEDRDKSWPMFALGFALLFFCTQIYSFPIFRKVAHSNKPFEKYIVRFVPLGLYIALVLCLYGWVIHPKAGTTNQWARMTEIVRIPSAMYMYAWISVYILRFWIMLFRKTGSSSFFYLILAFGCCYGFNIGISVIGEILKLPLSISIQAIPLVILFTITSTLSAFVLDRLLGHFSGKSMLQF